MCWDFHEPELALCLLHNEMERSGGVEGGRAMGAGRGGWVKVEKQVEEKIVRGARVRRRRC